MGGGSPEGERLRAVLREVCERGLDYLLVRLIVGNITWDELVRELARRGLHVSGQRIGDEATLRIVKEVWSDWKCRGRHHWLLLINGTDNLNGVYRLRLRCYACGLERVVLVEESELKICGLSPSYSNFHRLALILAEGKLGC